MTYRTSCFYSPVAFMTTKGWGSSVRIDMHATGLTRAVNRSSVTRAVEAVMLCIHNLCPGTCENQDCGHGWVIIRCKKGCELFVAGETFPTWFFNRQKAFVLIRTDCQSLPSRHPVESRS